MDTNVAAALERGGIADITTTGTAAVIYARFRFTASTGQGGDSPTGVATVGEVEDYVLLSLGNTVWWDNGAGGGTPNDGLDDAAGESGIAGVTVTLYRDDGDDDPEPGTGAGEDGDPMHVLPALGGRQRAMRASYV